ncbi:O-antigen ligase family protein [Candidatus Pelagibacter sp. HIMB1695]|uniref:O-antigen ligase family protein n=1 Tax=Candidatus Pelagibacter sp. HIMB1695 TaxID=3413364 RepID=UPI003F8574DE
MNNLNLKKFEQLLIFLVLIFPLILVFRSFTINLVLILISGLSIYYFLIEKNYVFFEDFFIKYLLFFLLIIFINSIFKVHDFETSFKSFSNFRYVFLTFAVFFSLSRISEKNFKLFIFFNSILITLISLDILYQFNFNENIFGFPAGMCTKNENCVRFSGIFGSELIGGTYLSQIGLLIFLLLKNNNHRSINFKKFFCDLMILFLFIIVFLTGERNAFLIFVMSLFLICLLNKQILKLFVPAFVFILLFLLIFQNSNLVKIRYLNLMDHITAKPNEKSFKTKIKNTPWFYHYQAAFELFLEKPVLGHGYKSFRVKCLETKIDKKLVENKIKYKGYRACSSHPHNYMMELLSENGIIGFLLYFGFILLIILRIIKILKTSEDQNKFIALGIGSLLLSILFPLKPSGSLFTTFSTSIFFYLLGFFIFYTRQTK